MSAQCWPRLPLGLVAAAWWQVEANSLWLPTLFLPENSLWILQPQAGPVCLCRRRFGFCVKTLGISVGMR